MYYTVIKHSGHLRTLEKCRKHSPATRVFYISLVFSNARRVLSQCNARLRLLYLLNKIYYYYSFLTGKYHESLSDAKSATELQPTFLKAIVRGKLSIIKFFVRIVLAASVLTLNTLTAKIVVFRLEHPK